MTTYCAQVELRQLGEEMRHSASLAKKLEKRRCTHNPAVSAAECIKQVIGAYNKDHYCVATQDSDLRILLREIPGTPLIYMNNSATVLEPVSSITMDRVKQLELKKLQPKEFERIPSSNRGLNQSGLVHKRRKIKEPNPLSVKKPKKIPSDSAVDAKNNAQGSKRKRKRKSSGLPSIEENESGPTA